MKRATFISTSMLAMTVLMLSGCSPVALGKSINTISVTKGISNSHSASSSTTNSSTFVENTKSGQSTASTTNDTGGYNQSKTSLGDIISGLYSVEGKIVQVNKTDATLNSITLQITKHVPTVSGTTPPPVGTKLVIYFDEPLSKMGKLKLTKGTTITVTYGQFVRHSDNKTILGSNFGWLIPDSSNTKSGQNTASTTNDTSGYNQSKTSLGDIISGLYSVKGKIVQVNKTNTTLNSITLQITKQVPTVSGTTPPPVGTKLVIFFDEPLSKMGKLKLTKGTTITVTYGQFVRHSDNKTILGSNFGWITD